MPNQNNISDELYDISLNGIEEKLYGCEHYKRKCSLISPCCNQMFVCRLCHDEEKDDNEPDYKKAHKMQCH